MLNANEAVVRHIRKKNGENFSYEVIELETMNGIETLNCLCTDNEVKEGAIVDFEEFKLMYKIPRRLEVEM